MTPPTILHTNRGERRGEIVAQRANDLSYRIALAGLGLLLLAALMNLGFPTDQAESRATNTAGAVTPPVQGASNSGIPPDLLPERIRLPELPEPDEPAPPSENPSHEDSVNNPSLRALKVNEVGLRGPAPLQVTFALPGAPDQLTAGIFSLAGVGEVGRAGSRASAGGWGGVGVRGVGIGRVGGGTCGRNPARPIIERWTGLPR